MNRVAEVLGWIFSVATGLVIALAIAMVIFANTAISVISQPQVIVQQLEEEQVFNDLIPSALSAVAAEVDRRRTTEGEPSLSELLNTLQTGTLGDVARLIIPEGWVQDQIVNLVQSLIDQNTDLNIDLAAILANIERNQGDIVFTIIESLPLCSEEQVSRLAEQERLEEIASYVFCRPPDEYGETIEQVVNDAIDSFKARLEELPSLIIDGVLNLILEALGVPEPVREQVVTFKTIDIPVGGMFTVTLDLKEVFPNLLGAGEDAPVEEEEPSDNDSSAIPGVQVVSANSLDIISLGQNPSLQQTDDESVDQEEVTQPVIRPTQILLAVLNTCLLPILIAVLMVFAWIRGIAGTAYWFGSTLIAAGILTIFGRTYLSAALISDPTRTELPIVQWIQELWNAILAAMRPYFAEPMTWTALVLIIAGIIIIVVTLLAPKAIADETPTETLELPAPDDASDET